MSTGKERWTWQTGFFGSTEGSGIYCGPELSNHENGVRRFVIEQNGDAVVSFDIIPFSQIPYSRIKIGVFTKKLLQSVPLNCVKVTDTGFTKGEGAKAVFRKWPRPLAIFSRLMSAEQSIGSFVPPIGFTLRKGFQTVFVKVCRCKRLHSHRQRRRLVSPTTQKLICRFKTALER